jgi:surfeit locus 1 family protein
LSEVGSGRPGRPAVRTFLAVALGLIGLAILLGLGTWQVQRLHWKEGIMARAADRVAQPAVPAEAVLAQQPIDFDAWEYRPVSARGTFRHDFESRVYTLLGEPRGPLEGPGYWILTPLQRAEGGFIIVNRGFVPLDRAGPEFRPEAQVQGDITVQGLLRAPEARNPFTPDDKPQQRLFYARDAGAIGAGLGLDAVAPFTLDARESGPAGLPQGGETRLTFTNRHMEYALTWYGLAASLAAVMVAAFWRRRRAI